MKRNLYMYASLILLVALGAIIFVGSGSKSASVESGTVAAQDMGSYQKVVLGIKNGNYYPNTISVEAGKPVRFYLDESVQGCYRSLVIPAFNVRQSLRTSSDYVEFNPSDKGEFKFSCSMGMGHGILVVA
jgi:plastocyanin domain-containing protein